MCKALSCQPGQCCRGPVHEPTEPGSNLHRTLGSGAVQQFFRTEPHFQVQVRKNSEPTLEVRTRFEPLNLQLNPFKICAYP